MLLKKKKMLRAALRRLDKTKAPHKHYKYGYIPDPRKLMPMETIASEELEPTLIRPPNSFVPNTDRFLERLDVNDLRPAADFKSSFTSWTDLMTASVDTMVARGIPRKTAKLIHGGVRRFHCGVMPDQCDRKPERVFWRQFDSKDHAHRIIPELPEKYRPHQLGEESRAIPNFDELNLMPAWAQQK